MRGFVNDERFGRVGLAAAAALCVGLWAAHARAQQDADGRGPAGPGERIGARLDAAVNDLAALLKKHSREWKGVAADVRRGAERWLDDGKSALIGVEDAPRTFVIERCCIVPTGDAGDPWDTRWTPVRGSGDVPERVVLLVHGLDEPGGMWEDLAPALVTHGLAVVKFDFPNDQGIADSADMLAAGLQRLGAAGARRVDIVAHSMGGLVVRDVLTRGEWYASRASAPAASGLPVVERVVLMSVPNLGSAMAPLQPLSEIREHATRAIEGRAAPGDGLLHAYADGRGEAAIDLAPGSAFLTELNTRVMPVDAAITNITASLVASDLPGRVDADLAALARSVRALGADDSLSVKLEPALSKAVRVIGDGLVPMESQELPGVSDVVRLECDHRGMVQRWRWLDALDPAGKHHPVVPPAIPVILDRLLSPAKTEAGSTNSAS